MMLSPEKEHHLKSCEKCRSLGLAESDRPSESETLGAAGSAQQAGFNKPSR